MQNSQSKSTPQLINKPECLLHLKDFQSLVYKPNTSQSNVTNLICSKCNRNTCEDSNVILFCGNCGKGFHQSCHVPTINKEDLTIDATWFCRVCVFALFTRKGGSLSDGPAGFLLQVMKRKCDYDINELTWDKAHKTNDQEIYCYCGGTGQWNLKMLQCYKCLQWFHEKCLQCVDGPILNGDRFYIFACAICNNGNEYLKRLPLRWVDVVHLVLYNITLVKKGPYFDLTETILPYFNNHWEELRLGELVHEASTRHQLRERVIETLQNNSVKFQCGSESKKAKTAFRLRYREAPEPPKVQIPACDVIDDVLVESLNLRHGSSLITMAPTPPPPPVVASSDARNSESASDILTTSKRPYRRKKPRTLIYDTSEDSQDSTFEIPVKRGRGRPRRDGSFPPSRSSVTNGLSKCRSNKLKSFPTKKISTNKPTSFSSYTPSVNKNLNTVLLASTVSEDLPVDQLNSSRPIPMKQMCNNFDLISQIPKPSDEGFNGSEYKPIIAQYYSAAGRISAGEKYIIHAKRTSICSSTNKPKTEYLIEWLGFTAKELNECQHKH